MPSARHADADLPLLTERRLNRATLARQQLLKRTRRSVEDAIDRLAGLQAQWPASPYVALWTRLAPFARADLTKALEERRAVKATLMRSTLHLVSAREYPLYFVASAACRGSAWIRPEWERGLDLERIEAELAAYTREPRTLQELLAFVGRWVEDLDRRPYVLRRATVARRPVIHVPPSGTWGATRARYRSADAWLGPLALPEAAAATIHVVRRYLAAFGPASLSDVAAWSGAPLLGPIRAAVEALGAEVRAFRTADGRRLYDLSRAPRPSEDTAAPVRLLPKWDSLLLAHEPARRTRVLPEVHRKTVIRKNGDVMQTFLVDGVVAGTWEATTKKGEATVTLAPFGRLARTERAALLEEAERLARFIAPEARAHGARL
ncbi:MAG: winged helix DNA-binding domain-containing protein [Candidatus Limnocylindria bacterium]